MCKKLILILVSFSVVWFSCEKNLNITDFEDDFGYYKSELKIEGFLKQDNPENSIVRIIRTSPITNTDVYNSKDDDGDGEIDEYDETLPLLEDTSATVKVTNLTSGEEIDFKYMGTNTESSKDGYGVYKPIVKNFQLETYAQYQLEIYSKDFNKTITALTTVYPPVNFIDTLHTFEDDNVIMNPDDTKEIFWKSDLNVSAYYITYEEMEQIQENEWESEFSYSEKSSRDNALTEKYKNYSIGHEVVWEFGSGSVLKLTVEALSPEYGHYIFSSLPLNDPQRSNLRDAAGDPVMGCFGATAAKSIFIVIDE